MTRKRSWLNRRQVTFEEGQKYAGNNKLIFFEISSMSNQEVNKPFYVMTCEIYDKIILKQINVEGEVRLKAGD